MKKDTEKRTGRMTNISEAFRLSEEGNRLFSNDSFRFWCLQKKWEDIAGPTLASESYISFERGTTLYISVTNSVWMQQLFMMKADILKRIREDDLGRKYKEIRFVAGQKKIERPPESSLSVVNDRIEEQKKMFSVTISEEEKQAIGKWADRHVQNENILPVFKKMMLAASAKRKGELEAGWHPCSSCGTLIPPEISVCPLCESRQKQSQTGKVMLLLREDPHLTYEEIFKKVPCDYTSYEEGREQLMQRIRTNIYKKTDAPLNKRILLSMLLHKPLKDISLREAETALKNMP